MIVINKFIKLELFSTFLDFSPIFQLFIQQKLDWRGIFQWFLRIWSIFETLINFFRVFFDKLLENRGKFVMCKHYNKLANAKKLFFPKNCIVFWCVDARKQWQTFTNYFPLPFPPEKSFTIFHNSCFLIKMLYEKLKATPEILSARLFFLSFDDGKWEMRIRLLFLLDEFSCGKLLRKSFSITNSVKMSWQ